MSRPSAASKAPASFEDAMTELESLVRSLETGQLSLEQAIDAYERGVKLRQFCQQTLDSARLRVEKIVESGNGGAVTEPFPVG
jgi:exodeoxyribonuclease VII small subunit